MDNAEDDQMATPEAQRMAEDLAAMLDGGPSRARDRQEYDADSPQSQLDELASLGLSMRMRAPELAVHFQADALFDPQFAADLRSSLLAAFADAPAVAVVERADETAEIAARAVSEPSVTSRTTTSDLTWTPLRVRLTQLRRRVWLLGLLAVALAIGLLIALQTTIRQPVLNGARGTTAPTQSTGADQSGSRTPSMLTAPQPAATPAGTQRAQVTRPPVVNAAPARGTVGSPSQGAPSPETPLMRPFAAQAGGPLSTAAHSILPPHLGSFPSTAPLYAIRHAPLAARAVAATVATFDGMRTGHSAGGVVSYRSPSGTLQVALQAGRITWTAGHIPTASQGPALPPAKLQSAAVSWLKAHSLDPADMDLSASVVISSPTSVQVRFVPSLPGSAPKAAVAAQPVGLVPNWLSVTMAPNGVVTGAVDHWPVLVKDGEASLVSPAEALSRSDQSEGVSVTHRPQQTVFIVNAVRLVYQPDPAGTVLHPAYSLVGTEQESAGRAVPYALLLSALKHG